MSAISGFIPWLRTQVQRAVVVAMGLVCWAVVAPSTASGGLVINELLPDPAGSDSGREFVELMNTGPDPVALEQVELQFANGAVGASWVTRWVGHEGLLASGSRLLLVDRNWQGEIAGDAEVYLGLQNGPDAIRLVTGTTVLDLVGYGSLTDAALFEGAPVPISPGLSLSRRPDGRDSDNNAADFVAVQPTPGSQNFQPYSVSLTEIDRDPPVVSRPGASLRVSISLRNDGTEPLPAGPCHLVWKTGTVGGWWDGATPDDERTLVFVASLTARGEEPLWWEYPVPGRTDTLRVSLGVVQVGASDLRLNEVMPAPDQGQGEWLELKWTAATAINIEGYQIRDEDGAWTGLPPVTLVAGDLLVVAQDSLALANWQVANLTAGGQDCGWHSMIRPVTSWPSLNNAPPEDRLFADRVYLASPAGTILDVVAWGGVRHELPDRGLSLERIGPEPVNPGAANWTVSTARAGSSPGCANSVEAVVGAQSGLGAVDVVPPVLDRQEGATTVRLQFVLDADEVAWELQIFNLWGDGVRDFGGDARGPGPRELLWDGTDDRGRPAGPGAYLVWLEIRTGTGVVTRRLTSTLVVR